MVRGGHQDHEAAEDWLEGGGWGWEEGRGGVVTDCTSAVEVISQCPGPSGF